MQQSYHGKPGSGNTNLSEHILYTLITAVCVALHLRYRTIIISKTIVYIVHQISPSMVRLYFHWLQAQLWALVRSMIHDVIGYLHPPQFDLIASPS